MLRNQFYLILQENKFLEKLHFHFLVHRNLMLHKSLQMNNVHVYYLRHTGAICKVKLTSQLYADQLRNVVLAFLTQLWTYYLLS